MIDEWLSRAFGYSATAPIIGVAVLLAALYGHTSVLALLFHLVRGNPAVAATCKPPATEGEPTPAPPSATGLTPVHSAAASPSAPSPPRSDGETTRVAVARLHMVAVIMAAMGLQLPTLRFLADDRGVSVGAVLDDKRSTPMMYAAEQGGIEVMRWLADQRCEIDGVDDLSSSALLYAAAGAGSLGAVQWLCTQVCFVAVRW